VLVLIDPTPDLGPVSTQLVVAVGALLAQSFWPKRGLAMEVVNDPQARPNNLWEEEALVPLVMQIDGPRLLPILGVVAVAHVVCGLFSTWAWPFLGAPAVSRRERPAAKKPGRRSYAPAVTSGGAGAGCVSGG
jgi:hypothetical protein